MNLQDVISKTNAKRSGQGWVARCPAHNDNNPSLSFRETENGKILFKCFAGCSHQQIVSALGLQKSKPSPASILWSQGKTITSGSPVAQYFKKRGIPEAYLEMHELRFSESSPYYEEGKIVGRFPALLGRIVDQSGKFVAVQRTFLTQDGDKASVSQVKKVLGKMSRGTIRFGVPDHELALAEGIETALAVQKATGLVTWATVSAGNLEKTPIPKRVTKVHIFADRDRSETGQKAAESLAVRLKAAKISVTVHIPPGPIPESAKSVDWLDIYASGNMTGFEETMKLEPEPKAENVGFTLQKISDLMQEPPEKIQYVIADLFPTSGISLLVGKPKSGKTTLSRYIAFCVSRGLSFLQRKAQKGKVIYLALEEKKSEVIEQFRAMGADERDEILLHVARATKNPIADLEKLIQEQKPDMVIIDPLFLFIRVKDSNQYSEVTEALEPLRELARKYGPHIMCVHHTGKAKDRAGTSDSVLGSTAIVGAVDCTLMLTRTDSYRIVKSEQRYGVDIEETVLNFNAETRAFSAGETKEFAETKRIGNEILRFLDDQEVPVLEEVIRESVEGRNKVKVSALRYMVSNNCILRQGAGGKGDPYKYTRAKNQNGSPVDFVEAF